MKNRCGVVKCVGAGVLSSSLVFSVACQTAFAGLGNFKCGTKKLCELMKNEEDCNLNFIVGCCSAVLKDRNNKITDIDPVFMAIELLIYAAQEEFRKKTGEIVEYKDRNKIIDESGTGNLKQEDFFRQFPSFPLDVKIARAMCKRDELIKRFCWELKKEKLGSMAPMKDMENKADREKLINDFRSNVEKLQNFWNLFIEGLKENFKICKEDLNCFDDANYEAVLGLIDGEENKKISTIEELYKALVDLRVSIEKYITMTKENISKAVFMKLTKECNIVLSEGNDYLKKDSPGSKFVINNSVTPEYVYFCRPEIIKSLTKIREGKLSITELIENVEFVNEKLEFVKKETSNAKQNEAVGIAREIKSL